MDKVSIIIPTYNRFKYLLNSIKSCIEQTYKNIEIIVVNDCSTEKEYYNYDFKKLGKNVYIIHLPKNSKDEFGITSPGGHARNIGITKASGNYIAFLDDDDYFLPKKIEKQVNIMKNNNYLFTCTDGYFGRGLYDKNKRYHKYHYKGYLWEKLMEIFTKKKKLNLLFDMYSKAINIWGSKEISVHNCIICSSVMIHKDLIKKVGYFKIMKKSDDLEYWKRILNFTHCIYIKDFLTYIDNDHGYGKNY